MDLAILRDAGDLFGMVSLRDPNSKAMANRDLQRSGRKFGHELNHLGEIVWKKRCLK